MIKILNDNKDFLIDTAKQHYFSKLFQEAKNEIEKNDDNYNLEPEIVNQNQCTFQIWQFSFCGKQLINQEDKILHNNYEGKKISGKLKFPKDFPDSAPVFYFDEIPLKKQRIEVQFKQNEQMNRGFYDIDQYLKHINIYGDNKFCLPLLSFWKSQTEVYDILQAIEYTFNNPNYAENDAPANPLFAALSIEDQCKISKIQAEVLSEFKKE